MHIGLLGGAFDPPHMGHILVAQQVLDYGGVDEVWFVPNYTTHHLRSEVVSIEHRLAMIRMLKLPHTRVSTIEIENKLDGKTIHLLPFLPKEHTYSFIIGADWLPTFHKWQDYQELLKQISFLVIPRYGSANEPLYEHMTVLENENLMTSDISATKIRERVKQGLSIDPFVPPGVAEYIKRHKLYSKNP
jgi:nicotinate-nucleotide adenylyltransferase